MAARPTHPSRRPVVSSTRGARGVVSVLGLLMGLVVLAGLAGAYWGWKSYTAKTKTVASGSSVLREDPWSVAYAPGAGQTGAPMQLDVLDVRSVLHLPFLVRNGMVGLKDQAMDELRPEQLGRDGFPMLELTWPSVHLPAADWCVNRQIPTVLACPVFAMRLSSRPMTEKDHDLLSTDAILPDQEPLAVTQRTASLWTAFTTLRRDSHRQWAGWLCEVDYLVDRNEDLHSWGLDEDVFPIDLADTTCHVPTTRLTRFWPELAYHWPSIGGYDVHPVIWQCPLRKGAACEARFEHGGRLVTLEVPGGVILGGDLNNKAPHLSVRPRLVQAAWAMLEDAARQAHTPSDAAQQAQRWRQSLQQELKWCEALTQHHTAFQATQSPAAAQKMQPAWSQPPWLTSSPHPRGPCARSFHRLLHLLEVAEKSKTPATAFPAAVWTQALTSAHTLAAMEKEQLQRQSDPVWHLVDELMTHAAGSTATPAATIARLSWHHTPERLSRDPVAVWRMLEAAGDAVTQMPAVDLIRLRMNLAWALERKARDGGEGQAPVSADQITTLFLQATQLWLSQAQDPLSPVDGVALLTHTASHVRAFGNRPAADGSSREAQAADVLGALVQGMDKLARQIAPQSGLSAAERVAHLGTLAVHGAWHAQYLAFLPTQDAQPAPAPARGRPHLPPLDAAWVQWLDEWTQWHTTQLTHLPQGPRLIAGVEVHRDATRSGKRPATDCPGAHLLGCKMAQP